MTAQRILLINPDGTAEVGGVKVRVVPVEPQREMLHSADNMMDGDLAYSDLQAIYSCMLSAAAIDLSGVPRVPQDWCVMPLDDMRGIYGIIKTCMQEVESADESDMLSRLLERAEEAIFQADWRRIERAAK